jgi:hypothetical protein
MGKARPGIRPAPAIAVRPSLLTAGSPVPAPQEKRRFRGKYRCVCLSHVQEREGAGVGGAFPEAVHARKEEETGHRRQRCAGRSQGRAVAAGVVQSVGFVSPWAVRTGFSPLNRLFLFFDLPAAWTARGTPCRTLNNQGLTPDAAQENAENAEPRLFSCGHQPRSGAATRKDMIREEKCWTIVGEGVQWLSDVRLHLAVEEKPAREGGL